MGEVAEAIRDNPRDFAVIVVALIAFALLLRPWRHLESRDSRWRRTRKR